MGLTPHCLQNQRRESSLYCSLKTVESHTAFLNKLFVGLGSSRERFSTRKILPPWAKSEPNNRLELAKIPGTSIILTLTSGHLHELAHLHV